MEKISFVIPCYRSERTIKEVVEEIHSLMGGQDTYSYEVILICDGSPDKVWDKIQTLCHDSRIKGILLSRNFGQASAVIAGYANVGGDYVITMDDDGQSPVDATFDLLNCLKEKNYDVVYGVCDQARYGLLRRIGSKVNSKMAKSMYNRPEDKRIVNYVVARRFVVDEMRKYDGPYTYISGLVYRTTKNVGYIDVKHRERREGVSGYSFKKLIEVWMNGFTAFSIKPLRLASYLGFFMAFIGVVSGCITIANKLIHPQVAVGWSSLISVMLILGGMNMLISGLIGEYVGRVYMCINKTPQYVIKKAINIEYGNMRNGENGCD